VLPSAEVIAQNEAKLKQIFERELGQRRQHDLLDYVASLDLGTVKAMVFDLAGKPRTSATDYNFLPMLMNRWTELDAPSAVAWVKSLDHGSLKSLLAGQVLDVISARSPAVAIAVAAQLGYISTQLFSNYAVTDPTGALAALQKLPVGYQSQQYYTDIFHTWATKDPVAAALAALSLPPSANRSQVMQTVADIWAQTDPDGALNWAQGLPAGSAQMGAVKSALEEISQTDPAYAFGYAFNNLPEGDNRDALLGNITNTWAGHDPAGLLTFAGDYLTDDAYYTTATLALKGMINYSASDAADALAQLNDPDLYNQVMGTLSFYYSKQDPAGALAWATGLPTDGSVDRSEAIAGVLAPYISSDPVNAANYVQQYFASDPAFPQLARSIAGAWVHADPQAGLNWAVSLPVGDAQNQAVGQAILAMSPSDAAAAWAAAQQLPAAVFNADLNGWAGSPILAAVMLPDLPPGDALNTAIAVVAQQRARRDPAAAAEWIDTLTPGPARDSAVTQLVNVVGQNENDPAAAFPWAVSLGDETERNAQVVNMATQWSKQNPTAAAAAVQGAMNNLTNLTPEQQTALQNVLDKAAAN
jgi:hypothetical protein